MPMSPQLETDIVALLRRYSKGLRRAAVLYGTAEPDPGDDGEPVNLDHREIDALLARAEAER